MVRSSSSKPTKDKKSTAAKSTSTKAKSSSEKTTTKKASSSKTAPAGETSKSRTAATQKKATSAATEKSAASRTKSTAKPAAAKSASGAAASTKKQQRPVPRTPELFEDLTAEQDIPSVSILPALADEPQDLDQVQVELNTPPEFRTAEVPQFSETPTAAATSTTELPVEKEVTFSFLGFNDQILGAIHKQGFQKPTKVQALCLPHTLDGKDVAGFAQTGTGKTAVYLLTAAHKLLNQEARSTNARKPQVLVVVPTRELADQVSQDAKKLLNPLKLKSLAVFGGVDVERHVSELNQAVDIVVATPGRLLDLHRSKSLEFDDLQLLVIDECDRMFDMGFIDDVEYVLRHLPAERVQKLLFSATGSEKVKELAFEYLENPEYIETDPVSITPEKISQSAYAVTSEHKFLTLMGHLKANNPECAIIFTNTKVVAEWVGYKLACNGLNAEVLTGDLPQRKRMTLIKKIKEGKCNLLVATDVLSRGLHVANLSHVYNFDIPDDAESFIHRIGRTARAGATGHAITLICEDYGYNMGAVEKLLGFPIPLVKVPNQYLTATDTSDYPFDETGRVKVFGQTAQASEELPKSETREHEHRRERHVEGARHSTAGEQEQVRSGRPEPTLPHHRRDATTVRNTPAPAPVQPKSSEVPAVGISQPIPAAAAAASASGHTRQAHGPSRTHEGPQAQPYKAHAGAGGTSQPSGRHPARGPAAGGTSSPTSVGGGMQRRDDKARETIEMAIQAAKKAAAKRQGGVTGSLDAHAGGKTHKNRVTAHIDEFAASVLNTAQERLGGTFGNLQDRFVSGLEENFPRLSETLVRLGFFSKRFTDDR
ncbi:MAG: ATP-dependent helicase RhlB [Pseudomonadota bacterium]